MVTWRIEVPRPVLELGVAEMTDTGTWATEWRVTVECGGVELFCETYSDWEGAPAPLKVRDRAEAEDRALREFGERLCTSLSSS